MFLLIITDDYDSSINCTDKENDDNNFNPKYIPLSIPGGILLLSLLGVIIYTNPEPLFSQQLKKGSVFHNHMILLNVLLSDPKNVVEAFF